MNHQFDSPRERAWSFGPQDTQAFSKNLAQSVTRRRALSQPAFDGARFNGSTSLIW
jgi:hypothetical protein